MRAAASPITFVEDASTLSASISRAEDARSPTRWEYKIWVQPDALDEISSKEKIEKKLNTLGAQGWELVSVMWKKHSDRTSPEGRAIHYFRRPLVAQQVEKSEEPSSKSSAEQPGAGQPTTQHRDEAPVKVQPSTPTPKEGPR